MQSLNKGMFDLPIEHVFLEPIVHIFSIIVCVMFDFECKMSDEFIKAMYTK